VQLPSPELSLLREKGSYKTLENIRLDPTGSVILPGIAGDSLELRASFKPGEASAFGFELRADGNFSCRLTYEASLTPNPKP